MNAAVAPTRHQVATEVREAMTQLLTRFALVLEAARNGDNGAQDTEILVADHIPLATWNRFAEMDRLPGGLNLQQLVWSDGRVLIVEFPISAGHEFAIGRVQAAFGAAFGGYYGNQGHTSITGPGSNGGLVTYSPDFAFNSLATIPGAQEPRGGASVIVEVMRRQQWESTRAKVQVYRQLDGVEYVFCLKMSLAMNSWSYELYDVGNNIPAYPEFAQQHSFDICEANVPVNHQHLVHFDSRRVLGLPQGTQLPPGIPDEAEVNLVDVALLARRGARFMGEEVSP